jgi:hypothetical protein
MPTCASCGLDYRWIDAADLCCPSCGHDPTDLGAAERRLGRRLTGLDEKLGGRLDHLSTDLDGRLADLDRRLDGDRPTHARRERDGLGLRGKERGASGSEPRFPPGFLPDAPEIGELRQLVFRSRHVRQNGAYEDAASGTRFSYFEDDLDFNAFATRDAVGPRVVILGGLVREFGAMAVVVTSDSGGTGQGLRAYTERRLATAPADPLGALPLAAQPSAEDIARLHHARELLCAMVMYVIGHELGHVCYGHIFGPGYSGQPLEVCQNQERDADSFASSVIASSTSKEHWFAGQIFALLTMAVFEAHGVVAEFATHPTACERLRNAVRSNPEAAAAMGITEELVDQIAPAPGSMVEG